MKLTASPVFALLMLMPISFQAQSIEDVEQKLRDAKDKQAQQADRSALAERERKASEAAAASRSVLIVRADAPCDLRLNGVQRGLLGANAAASFDSNAGKQLVECFAENGSLVFDSVVDLAPGSQEVLILAVKEKISKSDLLTQLIGSSWRGGAEEKDEWEDDYGGKCRDSLIDKYSFRFLQPASSEEIFSVAYLHQWDFQNARRACYSDDESGARSGSCTEEWVGSAQRNSDSGFAVHWKFRSKSGSSGCEFDTAPFETRFQFRGSLLEYVTSDGGRVSLDRQ